MTRHLLGQSKHVAGFVADNIPGCDRGFGECTAIGFVDGNRLIAGVVYHNWEPEARVIELSSASVRRDWLTKSHLRRIFEYPFDLLDCRICVARTSEQNKRVRRIWSALGATEHLIPELRGPNEAEIILTLHAETWHRSRFAKE